MTNGAARTQFRQIPPQAVPWDLDRPYQRERFGETGSVLPEPTRRLGVATILSERRKASDCSGCTQSGSDVGFSAFVRSDSAIRVSLAEPIFVLGSERKVVRFRCAKFERNRQERVILSRAGLR